jgi:hypothetical protein
MLWPVPWLPSLLRLNRWRAAWSCEKRERTSSTLDRKLHNRGSTRPFSRGRIGNAIHSGETILLRSLAKGQHGSSTVKEVSYRCRVICEENGRAPAVGIWVPRASRGGER